MPPKSGPTEISKFQVQKLENSSSKSPKDEERGSKDSGFQQSEFRIRPQDRTSGSDFRIAPESIWRPSRRRRTVQISPLKPTTIPFQLLVQPKEDTLVDLEDYADNAKRANLDGQADNVNLVDFWRHQSVRNLPNKYKVVAQRSYQRAGARFEASPWRRPC